MGGQPGRAHLYVDTQAPVELEIQGRKTVLQGKFDYTLPIAPPAELPLQPLQCVLRQGAFERRFEVPYRVFHDLRQGAFHAPFALETGEIIGTIALARQGEILQIEAKVVEPEPRPARIPWQGSVLELFWAGAPEKRFIRQFFLKPDGAFLAEQDGQYVPPEFAALHFARTANGYRAQICYPWACIPGFTGDTFRFTAALTVHRPAGKASVILFGVKACLQDIERYAVMQI